MTDTEASAMLTPTDILEHVWCPRFTWFMRVQQIPQHEENRYKVQKGREVHERRERENKDYVRRKLGAVKKEIGVYLASPVLRLRGIVDELLWLKDGSVAPLDYKFTPPPEAMFKTHQIQVGIYGLLAAEVYQLPVHKGFVAYIRGGSEVHEVAIDETLRTEILLFTTEIFAIIGSGRLPKRTAQRVRCADCCYKNICA
jgi:CRISPR-associated exonuclease Cas4